MTRLTDGTKTVAITINTWTGTEYTPDQSAEFFEIGGLENVFVENLGVDAYRVDDVDYCIDYANDWANYQGDYFYDDRDDSIERNVDVEVLS